MNPYRPVSRSSTVYEYLIPMDLAQSSDAPAAIQIDDQSFKFIFKLNNFEFLPGYSKLPDGPTE